MKTASAANNSFDKFSKRVTAFILLVSLAPLVVVTGIVVERYQATYHAKVNAHLTELSQKHARTIDSFLQERLQNIAYLVRATPCGQLSDETFLQSRLADLQSAYGNVFQDMGVVDERGLQIAYAGPYELQHARYGEATWFKQARQHDTYVSDVFLGLRGFPHFIVTVRQNCRGRRRIVRATIDFTAFSAMVESLRVGETGHALIINRNGEFQTMAPKAPGAADFVKTVIMDLPKTGERVDSGAKIMERKDDEKKMIIFVTSDIKNGDWVLVVQQEKSDAFADLNRTHKMTIIIFILSGMAVVVTAFWVPTVIFIRISEKHPETTATQKET